MPATFQTVHYSAEADDWADQDDDLHTPSLDDDKVVSVFNMGKMAARKLTLQGPGHIFTARGIANIGCLFVLAVGTIALFAGYPIISYLTQSSLSTNGAYNLGGINGTGQVPDIPGFPRLVDPDTPADVMTRTGFDGNDDWHLVYSDEFNKDGRTFYEGDDPYWQGTLGPLQTVDELIGRYRHALRWNERL